VHGIDFDNVLGVVDVTHASFDDAAFAHRDDELASGQTGRLPWLTVAGSIFSAGSLLLLGLLLRRFGSAYLLQRLGVLLATLLAATAIIFAIVQVVPGDPVRYMMGLQAEPETVAAMRHQLGLDAGAWQRYVSWVGG
jgi:hypothetical protein